MHYLIEAPYDGGGARVPADIIADAKRYATLPSNEAIVLAWRWWEHPDSGLAVAAALRDAGCICHIRMLAQGSGKPYPIDWHIKGGWVSDFDDPAAWSACLEGV